MKKFFLLIICTFFLCIIIPKTVSGHDGKNKKGTSSFKKMQYKKYSAKNIFQSSGKKFKVNYSKNTAVKKGFNLFNTLKLFSKSKYRKKYKSHRKHRV